MARVRPFRAARYDPDKAAPIDTLVAPPYDVISPDERERYRARSPYNVVHLTLPDSEEEAGRTWRDWHDRGVIAVEAAEAAWELAQDYVGPDGVARTRRGIVAAVRVEPYDRRVVLPHERTHRRVKEERLRLLRAVRAQLEPLFLVYEGEPFAVPDGLPDFEMEGARLRRLADAPVEEFFADKQLLIADGHHRYETALAYHEETGTPESAWILAVLVSAEDPGLTIFPTHRVATKLDGRRFPEAEGDPRSMLAEIELESRGRAAAVVYQRGGAGKLYGRDGELDVQLVERYAPDVRYTPYADEAIAAVDDGAPAAFLVRPLAVEDVFAVARRGDVLPAKTTYFYPKLLSGLLFLPL